MADVLVRSHTRRKPAKMPDPFQDIIDARLSGQPVRFPPLPPAKVYTREEANRAMNSWLSRVVHMLAGRD